MLRGRTARFFGQDSPDKTWGDVADQIHFEIKRTTTRATDVVLASYSIGCDGRKILSLMDGSPCDSGGEDGIILATKDRGVLSGALPSPYQSNNPGTGGAQRSRIVEAVDPTGRYFVDTEGKLYDGRNGLYHAGRYPQTKPNGTALGTSITPPSDILVSGDERANWNTHWNGDVFTHGDERYDGASWNLVDPPLVDVPPYGEFTPHFCYNGDYSSMDPSGNSYGSPFTETHYPITSTSYTTEQAVETIRWLGRCSSTAQGYRNSSPYLGSIEGRYILKSPVTTGFYSSSMDMCVVFRDASTLDVVAYLATPELENYGNLNFPTRCHITAGPTVGFRAGFQIRPVVDGTWVVSCIDSDRAWVYEIAPVSDDDPTLTVKLLETVVFSELFAGVIRVVYQ